jgi:hypothetical protein
MTPEQEEEVVTRAVKDILGVLNGRNTQRLAGVVHEEIISDHRTVQQSFWSLMLLAQMQYAYEASDARNEAAVKLAYQVRQLAIKLHFDLGLPRI